MSEIPAEQNANPAANEQSEAANTAPTSKRSKLPDWQPLGTIRDYFTEQMKQDQLR